MSVIRKDLGMVTAYAYAVSKGYTGTEEEFAELMASYADVAEDAAESATAAAGSATAAAASASAAQGYKTDAQTAATSAGTSASTATSKASEAANSATQAAGSATAAASSASTASTKATQADTAAGNAATNAIAAAQSASLANTKATDAATSATAAANSATQAAASASSAASAVDGFDDHVQDMIDTIPEDYTELTEDVTQLKADLTSIETDIETGNLTAGTAEQLLADTGMTDKSPYLFRAMPTGAGDREEPVIVGGSVVWNQLVQNGNFESTDGWIVTDSKCSLSVSDNVATITATDAPGAEYSYSLRRGFAAIPTDHKVFFHAEVKLSQAGTVKVDSNTVFKNPTSKAFTNIPANQWTEIIWIATANNVSQVMYLFPTAITDSLTTGYTWQVRNYYVSDLTTAFPTAVADYIYTLESATAGAGLAYLRKYGFFTSDYYPYTEPTFKHVEGLVSHKIVGFNQWTNDKYETTTGAEIMKYGDDGLRVITYARQENTNKFPVVDTDSRFQISFDYKVTATSNANASFGVYFYYTDGTNNKNTCYMDAVDKTYHVSFISNNGKKVSHIAFGGWSYTGTADISNICLHLVLDGSRNGEYEPYKSHTYPLDPDVVLRGIPKLDASNNLYFDGDVYKADGTVSRRYGVVDLGTLTWSYESANQRFNAYGVPSINASETNLRCPIYTVGATATENMTMQVTASKALYIKNETYSDAATFKTAMSGVYLLYPLATPTTETADPYAPLQLADPYGTEEWVLDADAFPMPVGQETFYPENLRAKIEGLPWNFTNLIAPTEVSYTATRNYTAGNLLIVDNILYKVTVNIANGGAITPGTNVTATTLAEIISALQ